MIEDPRNAVRRLLLFRVPRSGFYLDNIRMVEWNRNGTKRRVARSLTFSMILTVKLFRFRESFERSAE